MTHFNFIIPSDDPNIHNRNLIEGTTLRVVKKCLYSLSQFPYFAFIEGHIFI